MLNQIPKPQQYNYVYYEEQENIKKLFYDWKKHLNNKKPFFDEAIRSEKSNICEEN